MSHLHFKASKFKGRCCICSAVKEISDLLNTGLDEETLQICVQLLEAGVNPEALAAVVMELRRETANIKVQGQANVLNPHCVGGWG